MVAFVLLFSRFCFKTGEECGKKGQDSAACYARFPGLGRFEKGGLHALRDYSRHSRIHKMIQNDLNSF